MRALVSLQMQGMPRAFEAFPAFFIWRSGARTFFQKNGEPFSHLFLCFFEHRSIHQIAAEGIGRALPLLFERRAGCTGEERVDLPFVFGGIHGAGDVGEVPAGRQVRPHGIEDAALEVDQPGYLPGWGYWKLVYNKVVAKYPQVKANKNFKRDMFNVAVGIIWQMCLTIIPMYIVIREGMPLITSILILAITTLVLKKNWYDKMSKDEVEYNALMEELKLNEKK